MISGDEGGTPSTGWWPEVRQTKAEPDPGAEIGPSPASSQLGRARSAGRVGQYGMTASTFPTGNDAMVSADFEQARLNR